MVLYFIPLLLCALTAFSRELSDDRRWAGAMLLFLCFFYCFGYMTGSDWKVYEFWYDNLDFRRFYYGYTNEPGYYLYMYPFNRFGIPFWPFFIFTKILLFAVICRTFSYFCRENIWVSMMYFLPWFGMYIFIDNPMRNCIAVGIFLSSIRYIMDRQFWRFFWCILLAASFHITALFILPFYFVLNRNVRNIVWVFAFLIVNIIFVDRDVLINVISSVFGMIPYLQNKVITYFLMDSVFTEGKVFSFGMIWHIFLFVLMLLYRGRIVDFIGGKKGQFVYNCAMVYLLLVRFAVSIPMFTRIQLYFSVMFSVCVGLVILSFEFRSRFMFVGLLLLVASYTCFDKITGSARYVPYSNYVEYVLKGELPSYSKRVFYNIKESPYTNEVDLEK